MESEQDGTIFSSTPITGPFDNEHTFTYTSVVATDTVLTASTLTKSFQITILAENAGGDAILNVVSFSFTNECNVFPILAVGDQIGWVRLTSVSSPSVQYCPECKYSA